MTLVRRLGAALLLVGTIAVWLGMAPEEADAPDNSAAVESIEVNDDLNNGSTEGAPQQTVVNGWTTVAYLKLISEQLDETNAPQPRDERPAALLALAVIGLALLAATSPSDRPSAKLVASGTGHA